MTTAREYAVSQYASTGRLDARIAIHRSSTNPRPLHPWLLDRLPVRPDEPVLEVGAGTGALWAAREPGHPWPRLTLTDASEAMCAVLRGRDFPGAVVRRCLADALPFADGVFAGAVANHMLYHLDEPLVALGELRRVLRPGGWFAATTNDDDSMSELGDLAVAAGVPRVRPPALPNFSAGNGPGLVARVFADVRVEPYDDVLVIRDPGLVVGYLDTYTDLTGDERAALRATLRSVIDAEGAFTITKRVVLITATAG